MERIHVRKSIKMSGSDESLLDGKGNKRLYSHLIYSSVVDGLDMVIRCVIIISFYCSLTKGPVSP